MKVHSEKFMNVSDVQVPDEHERMIVMMSSLAAIVVICKSRTHTWKLTKSVVCPEGSRVWVDGGQEGGLEFLQE